MFLSRLGRPLLLLSLCAAIALSQSSCAHKPTGGSGGSGGGQPKPKSAAGNAKPKPHGDGVGTPPEGPPDEPFGDPRDPDPHFRPQCNEETPVPHFNACGGDEPAPPAAEYRPPGLGFVELVGFQTVAAHEFAVPPSDEGAGEGRRDRIKTIPDREQEGRAALLCFSGRQENFHKFPGLGPNPVVRDLIGHMNPAASGEIEREGRRMRLTQLDPAEQALAASAAIHDWFDCVRDRLRLSDRRYRDAIYLGEGQVMFVNNPPVPRGEAAGMLPRALWPAELQPAAGKDPAILRRFMEGTSGKLRQVDLWRDWIGATSALKAEAKPEMARRAVQGMFFTMAALIDLKRNGLRGPDLDRFRNLWLLNTERMMDTLRGARREGINISAAERMLDTFRNPSVGETARMTDFRREIDDTFPPGLNAILSLRPAFASAPAGDI